MKRKPLLLIVLLILLGLASWYAYRTMPHQQRISSSTTRPPAAAAPAEEKTGLQLQLLKERDETFPGYRRNIFGSVLPPPPSPPKPAPVPAPKPTPAPAPVPAPPPRPAQPLQEALARFTFLGYLEKDGTRTVFLQRDNDLFVVKKGSRFGPDQKFEVVGMSPEQLIIRQAGDDRDITVPLTEKQPLRARFGSPARVRGPSSRSLPPSFGDQARPVPGPDLQAPPDTSPALPGNGLPATGENSLTPATGPRDQDVPGDESQSSVPAASSEVMQ
jgi:hypothetical protein